MEATQCKSIPDGNNAVINFAIVISASCTC